MKRRYSTMYGSCARPMRRNVIESRERKNSSHELRMSEFHVSSVTRDIGREQLRIKTTTNHRYNPVLLQK